MAARVPAWSRAHLAEPAFYWLMTHLVALALRVFARWEVEGAARVPASGPLLVVSNHLNVADPPLLGASLPRRIHFMAKQELFDARFAGFFIRLFGAFPVRRFEADLRTLRVARQLLERGEVIGMFPEGHRSDGTGMIRAHPGTALLALRVGVPVLPVAITGSEQIHSLAVLFKRPRIRVVVGEPFTLPPGRVSSRATADATDQIMRRVAAILPAPYRGVYTDNEVQ